MSVFSVFSEILEHLSLTFSLRSLSFSHREIPVSLGHRGECTKCPIDVPLPALRKSQNSRILPA